MEGDISVNRMPYELRLLALSTARSVWSKELYLEMCSEMQVNPSEVELFKASAMTIPQLRQIGAIKS